MTKKDYELIANAIKEHYIENRDYYVINGEANGKLSGLVFCLSRHLKAEDKKFDIEKFFAKAGLYN